MVVSGAFQYLETILCLTSAYKFFNLTSVILLIFVVSLVTSSTKKPVVQKKTPSKSSPVKKMASVLDIDLSTISPSKSKVNKNIANKSWVLMFLSTSVYTKSFRYSVIELSSDESDGYVCNLINLYLTDIVCFKYCSS